MGNACICLKDREQPAFIKNFVDSNFRSQPRDERFLESRMNADGVKQFNEATPSVGNQSTSKGYYKHSESFGAQDDNPYLQNQRQRENRKTHTYKNQMQQQHKLETEINAKQSPPIKFGLDDLLPNTSSTTNKQVNPISANVVSITNNQPNQPSVHTKNLMTPNTNSELLQYEETKSTYSPDNLFDFDDVKISKQEFMMNVEAIEESQSALDDMSRDELEQELNKTLNSQKVTHQDDIEDLLDDESEELASLGSEHSGGSDVEIRAHIYGDTELRRGDQIRESRHLNESEEGNDVRQLSDDEDDVEIVGDGASRHSGNTNTSIQQFLGADSNSSFNSGTSSFQVKRMDSNSSFNSGQSIQIRRLGSTTSQGQDSSFTSIRHLDQHSQSNTSIISGHSSASNATSIRNLDTHSQSSYSAKSSKKGKAFISKGFLNELKRQDQEIVYDEQEEEDHEDEDMMYLPRRSTQKMRNSNRKRSTIFHEKDGGYKSDDEQKYHKKSIQIDDVDSDDHLNDVLILQKAQSVIKKPQLTIDTDL